MGGRGRRPGQWEGASSRGRGAGRRVSAGADGREQLARRTAARGRGQHCQPAHRARLDAHRLAGFLWALHARQAGGWLVPQRCCLTHLDAAAAAAPVRQYLQCAPHPNPPQVPPVPARPVQAGGGAAAGAAERGGDHRHPAGGEGGRAGNGRADQAGALLCNAWRPSNHCARAAGNRSRAAERRLKQRPTADDSE